MTAAVETPRTAERNAARHALRQLLNLIDLDEQLRRRAVQQAISEASAWFWCWRAEQFHAAAPKPGDYHGRATRAELPKAYDRCMSTALACRRKAAFLDWEAGGPLIDPALGEVA